MDLNGKVAIVTGGTKGIGRAIAEALVHEGINVCISARKRSEIDQTVAELAGLKKGRVTGIVCDVCDHAQVKALIERTVEEFGGLDILVNNAGIGIFSTVEEWRLRISAPLWKQIFLEFSIAATKPSL